MERRHGLFSPSVKHQPAREETGDMECGLIDTVFFHISCKTLTAVSLALRVGESLFEVPERLLKMSNKVASGVKSTIPEL